MKTLDFENLSEYVLSLEEMINVRGGSATPDDPQMPPVIIEL